MVLRRSAPRIFFKTRKTGGVSINSTVALTHLDEKLVARILQEYKIHNAEILFKEDCTVDDLIDIIEGNRRCGTRSGQRLRLLPFTVCLFQLCSFVRKMQSVWHAGIPWDHFAACKAASINVGYIAVQTILVPRWLGLGTLLTSVFSLK